MTTTRFTLRSDGTVTSRPIPPGIGPVTGAVPGVPNCGPVALAAVVNVPVREMMDVYRDVCGYGPRWIGWTKTTDHEKVLDTLGVNWEPQPRKAHGTLGKWFDRHGVKGRTYLIRAGRHFIVVRNGWLTDQNGPRPADEGCIARSRVTHVYEVFI